MRLPELTSTKNIDKRFYTGEEPVLVECDDRNAYICKYSRYSGSANKLVCELLGALLAKCWQLRNPKIALVRVLPMHVPTSMSGSLFALPALGCRLVYHAVDVTPSSLWQIPPSEKLCEQLLRIALFDFWIANEDRNANNANLMYDVQNDDLIPIDFGCAFNTATLELPLSQLTETDSILASDLFLHLRKSVSLERLMEIAGRLVNEEMPCCLRNVRSVLSEIKADLLGDGAGEIIPKQWGIREQLIAEKMSELLSEQWLIGVKENFIECLKENWKNE